MLPTLDARIRLYNDNSARETKLLAFADLIIADQFVIKGIRILKKDAGLFIGFPCEPAGKMKDRWYDIAHPLTPEARKASEAIIFTRYEAAKSGVDLKSAV